MAAVCLSIAICKSCPLFLLLDTRLQAKACHRGVGMLICSSVQFPSCKAGSTTRMAFPGLRLRLLANERLISDNNSNTSQTQNAGNNGEPHRYWACAGSTSRQQATSFRKQQRRSRQRNILTNVRGGRFASPSTSWGEKTGIL